MREETIFKQQQKMFTRTHTQVVCYCPEVHWVLRAFLSLSPVMGLQICTPCFVLFNAVCTQQALYQLG